MHRGAAPSYQVPIPVGRRPGAQNWGPSRMRAPGSARPSTSTTSEDFGAQERAAAGLLDDAFLLDRKLGSQAVSAAPAGVGSSSCCDLANERQFQTNIHFGIIKPQDRRCGNAVFAEGSSIPAKIRWNHREADRACNGPALRSISRAAEASTNRALSDL